MVPLITIPIFTVTKMVSVATIGGICATFFTFPTISSAGISMMRVKVFLPAMLCATLAGDVDMQHLRIGYGWAWLLCLFPMIVGHLLGRFFMRFIPGAELHGLFLLSTTFQNCISYGMGITQSIGGFAGSNVAGGFPWITAAAKTEFPRVVFMWNLPHSLAVWGFGTVMVRNGKKREIKLNYERDLRVYEEEKERRAEARHRRMLERFERYQAAKEHEELALGNKACHLGPIAPMMALEIECPRLDRDCDREIPIMAALRAEEEEHKEHEETKIRSLLGTEVGGTRSNDGQSSPNSREDIVGENRESQTPPLNLMGCDYNGQQRFKTLRGGANGIVRSTCTSPLSVVVHEHVDPFACTPPKVPPTHFAQSGDRGEVKQLAGSPTNIDYHYTISGVSGDKKKKEGINSLSMVPNSDPLFVSSLTQLKSSGAMVINSHGDLITAEEAAATILNGGEIIYHTAATTTSTTTAATNLNGSSNNNNSERFLLAASTSVLQNGDVGSPSPQRRRRRRRMRRSRPTQPQKMIALQDGEYSDDNDLVPPVKPFFAPAVTGVAFFKEFLVECRSNITILASWVGLALGLLPPLKYVMDHTILGDIIVGSLAAVGGANLPLTLLQLGTNLISNQTPKDLKKRKIITVRETVFDKDTGQFAIRDVTKDAPLSRRAWLLEWIDSMEVPLIFVALVALIRLVIVPALFLCLFQLLKKAGDIPIIGPIPSSKAFQFTVLIESCGPTDINCSSLCAIFKYKIVPYSQALLCIYIISIFTTAMWLTVYLWILGD